LPIRGRHDAPAQVTGLDRELDLHGLAFLHRDRLAQQRLAVGGIAVDPVADRDPHRVGGAHALDREPPGRVGLGAVAAPPTYAVTIRFGAG
jgi:hypothetical protein